ncbi:MAG: hypothetical protein KIB40_03520 [Pantoea sp.]|uniref:Pectate lyase superfamily protein domain-containing protein n=1 Tax=Pantoea brenneri TaxID=472694 RepID=A0AAX3J4C9_9GAMM|nr:MULTISPECIES: glycosyl hydrolase family 28-related protein [Pantoea]MBS6032215.1 hypothetical protein [Pantoea sp.]VXB52413.1 hypothetical protein PANT111_150155 [Pantoea brenneri]
MSKLRVDQLSPTDDSTTVNVADLNKATAINISAATSLSLIDWIQQRKSLKDFGAKGDGINDDTKYVQQAFEWVSGDARGRELKIEAGQYLLSSEIVVDKNTFNARIYGAGSSITSFVWPTTAKSAGFKFGKTTPFKRVFMSGFSLNTKIVTSNPAMLCRADGSSAKQFVMKDILAYGDGLLGNAPNGYFGGGLLQLEDANYPILEDLIFYGVDGSKENYLLVPTGVKLTSRNNSMLVPHIINVSCSYVGYPFYVESIHVPGVEGLVMDRCNGMCVYGAKFTAQNSLNSAYYPPQYNISKTQFEFYEVGMDFNHVGAVTVDSPTLLHRPDSSAVATAIMLTDVNRAIIQTSYIEHRPSTKLNGIVVTGNSNNVTANNNTFDLPSGYTAVVFEGKTSNSRQFDNKLVNSVGYLYQNSSSDAGSNSSVPYKESDEISVTFSNCIKKSGSKTVTLGAGGLFTINFDTPFPNGIMSAVAVNGDSSASQSPVIMTSRSVKSISGYFINGVSGTLARVDFEVTGF